MKRIRWLIALLLVGMIAFVTGRSTGRSPNDDLEPAQGSAESAAGLDKLIGPFDFTHSTLREALGELQKQSDGKLLIDWPALEATKLDQATVNVKTELPARLGLVVSLVLLKIEGPEHRAAYSVVDSQGVLVSTEAVLGDAHVVTRIYDIRDLIVALGGTNSSVGTRTEAVDSIIKMIQDSVLSDQWKDNGGNIGAIRELAGQLIITHTRDGQRRVSDFLRQVREGQKAKGTIP